MGPEELVMICTSDIAGQTRGKAVPASKLEERRETGVGWTPTNVMITAHGPIAPSPWGALGDLHLRPDFSTRVRVVIGDHPVPENFVLADIRELDGRPWSCCLRDFLKRGLDRLRGHGLRLVAAFEHEFVLEGIEPRPNSPYNLDAFRRAGAFPDLFVTALRDAGLGPDTFMPEYAPGQYEVTIERAEGLVAADRAILLRELARAVAFRLGLRATFAPLLQPGGVGSGVHLHFSLTDANGRPVNHDPDGPGGVSATAGAFLEGVRRRLPALCALTAPSVVSYMRLVPHRWSAYWTNVGVQDREAAIRICPVFDRAHPERAFHFEYRAADATASPWMVLGAIAHAGALGIEEGLPPPRPTRLDPETLSEAEREEAGIRPLPRSLSEALDRLEADEGLKAAMGEELHRVYLAHKRYEAELLSPLDPGEQCARYVAAY